MSFRGLPEDFARSPGAQCVFDMIAQVFESFGYVPNPFAMVSALEDDEDQFCTMQVIVPWVVRS